MDLENQGENSIEIMWKSIFAKHILLIGHLLDVMKYANQEDERLNKLGLNLPGLGYVEGKLWDGIKLIIDMPLEEEIGVFVDDKWVSYFNKYINGEISKEETINFIVNWNLELYKTDEM